MKSYLIENHSTMFLVGFTMALMGFVATSGRSLSDSVVYLAFVIPALFFAGALYGAFQKIGKYTKPNQSKDTDS